MKTVMRIPVPAVLAYSSRPDNPVGAEYIIMEKQQGVKLGDVWKQLDGRGRWWHMKNLAMFFQRYAGSAFSKYGGIYFKRDVGADAPSLTTMDDHTKEETTHRDYAVGPSTSKMNHVNGRLDVEFDRGPCR